MAFGLWYLGGEGSSKSSPKDASGNLIYTKPGQAVSSTTQNNDLTPAATSRLNQLLADQRNQNKSFTQFDPASLTLVYKTSDLKTTSSRSTSTLETYGHNLVEVLRPLSYPREGDGQVMLRAFDNQDPSEVAKLSASSALYGQVAARLMAVTAPSDNAALQVEVANSLKIISLLVGNMSQVLTEPVLALQSGLAYTQLLPAFYHGLDLLNQYFVNRGITFPPSDQIQIHLGGQ